MTNFTINFPQSAVNGQLFTILLGTTNTISLNDSGGALSTLNNGAIVTYFYSS